MSQQLTTLTRTFLVSGTTITSYRWVAFTGTAIKVCDTQTAFPLGVAQATADPSTTVEVLVAGTTKVYCDTAVTAGDVLVAATNGSVIPKIAATFTHTSNYKVVGVALESGAVNGIIEMLIDRSQGVQA